MIDPAYVPHLQAVTGAQWRPAILAVEKLVGQARDQIGMIPQVAYLADAKLGSTISPHNESVGVVEPKLPTHPHPTLSKQRAHLISAQRLLRFQNFLGDRAGALGVKRNFAPLQGLPQHDRSTHSLPDLGCEARGQESRHGA